MKHNFNNIFSVKNTTICELKCTIVFLSHSKKTIGSKIAFFQNGEYSCLPWFLLEYIFTQKRSHKIAPTLCPVS